VNAVHGYIAGLRCVLEPGRVRRAPGRILTVDGPGYVLRMEPGALDSEMFCRHLATACESRRAGDLPAALSALDAGLTLWLDTPLLGIPGPWADLERIRLRELRLTALEDRAEMMLEVGRHTEVAAQLAVLISEHPLRERLRGALMLALYRCGRRADALAAYADARGLLVTDLGVEPGPELQRMHARILAADDSLDPVPGSVAACVTVRWPAPAQLPGDVYAFTGRTDELAELDRVLAVADSADTSAVVIIAVSGTAGVGKTTLAVHWAHRLLHRFPDGQLFADLRGHDPDRSAVLPAEALAGFLRALGMAGQDIPADVGERAAAYRSMLAGRRMLIILDNASSAEQVYGLLPGSSSCVAVVTSRNRLSGIIARHGARPVELDVLPIADAIALLRALIGGRVDAEPHAAMTLAAQCARLPLALRVAAEAAAANPTAPLQALAGELADERRRLKFLDAGGDPRTMVRSVFSWSYRHLPAVAARSFRMLGLHPGPDLDLYAAMALTDTGLEQAHSTLAILTTAHLIQGTRDGRYVMHDLLRAYAASLLDDPDEPRSAMTRMLDYYLATAASAMEVLAPAERNRRPVAPIAVSSPPVPDPARARAWLDAERAVLVAVTRHAARRGWPQHAIRLAATLSRYLVTGGHNTEAVAIYEHALDAARRCGDRGAQATAMVNLAEVRWRLGHRAQQAGGSGEALAIFREIGDRIGEARAHGNLALLAWRQGRYAEASCHYEQALAIFREIGDRAGEARALDNLGAICWRQGRYEQAAAQHGRALAIFGEIGDRAGQARALTNLGCVCHRKELLEQAARHLEHSLGLSRQTGDRACEAEALSDLGAVHLRYGRLQLAADNYRRAIALFREIGQQAGEAEALNGSGEVLLAMGAAEQARAQHALALHLALRVCDCYQHAGAHRGLARAHAADGNYRAARHHRQHALDLYTQLDVPEARDGWLSAEAPAEGSVPRGFRPGNAALRGDAGDSGEVCFGEPQVAVGAGDEGAGEGRAGRYPELGDGPGRRDDLCDEAGCDRTAADGVRGEPQVAVGPCRQVLDLGRICVEHGDGEHGDLARGSDASQLTLGPPDRASVVGEPDVAVRPGGGQVDIVLRGIGVGELGDRS
jgi:tetratricopeptide (TPR) repeat protein